MRVSELWAGPILRDAPSAPQDEAETAMRSNTGLDFDLGETADLLRDSVRGFAADKIAPRADEIDRSNTFPARSVAANSARSACTASRSRRNGAARGSAISSIAWRWRRFRARPARSGCPTARTPISASTRSAATAPTRRSASTCPKLISGEHVGALAMSEVGAGSDVVSMTTRADKKGDRYVLNGSKMWITNGPHAETLVVYAKTDPGAGARGITAFLIEKGIQGLLHRAKARQARHARLRHLRAGVPRLRGAGGERARQRRRRRQHPDVAASTTSAWCSPPGRSASCRRASTSCVPYVRERKQFGKAIGEFELVQGKLADMYVAMNASRAYVYAVAKACDRGRTTREDAAGAILYAAENATKVALDAIQLLGGSGYVNENPTGRFLRDAKLYEIGAGTSEIRRMLIGRELFNKG